MEKQTFEGRDLLSLLIKANMAADVPDSARMTDEEILARESESEYWDLDQDVDADPLRRGSHLPDRWPRDNEVLVFRRATGASLLTYDP